VYSNYINALKIKEKILQGETIKPDDFDLNIIIDRCFENMKKVK